MTERDLSAKGVWENSATSQEVATKVQSKKKPEAKGAGDSGRQPGPRGKAEPEKEPESQKKVTGAVGVGHRNI